MSTHDIAADQLKCVRALSVIPGFEPSLTPMLEGFFHEIKAPSVAELRAVLDLYADRYGLKVEEKPHGAGGMVGLHSTGMWSGVEVHVWGPARPEGGA